MESDLSSSEAALRMLLVEDVELLERGIFTLTSLLYVFVLVSKSDWSDNAVALSRPLPLCCAPRAFLFIQTGSLFLWGHLFEVSDVKHANLALINQCSESIIHLPTWSRLFRAYATVLRLYKHSFYLWNSEDISNFEHIECWIYSIISNLKLKNLKVK